MNRIALEQKQILTAGYAKRSVEELERVVIAHDAVVVDIRLSTRSRRPAFNEYALHHQLKDRYLTLRTWGNIHYKDGLPIAIKDFERGLAFLREICQNPNGKVYYCRSLILLCVCEAYDTCHRKKLSGLLAVEGLTTTELDWSAE